MVPQMAAMVVSMAVRRASAPGAGEEDVKWDFSARRR